MASIWTVKPETVQYDGSWNGNAFWISIKRRLNEGEKRKAQTAGFKSISSAGTAGAPAEQRATDINIDWSAMSFARTLVYLVDWSLADEKGNKLKISRDTVEVLHPDVYAEIERLINAHIEAQEQEKNAQSGATKREPISA